MITKEDIAFAYRKAKVDMYYSGIPYRSDIVEFEENLELQFRRLVEIANNPRIESVEDICTGWLLMPKKVDDASDDAKKSKCDTGIVFSDPSKQFEQKNKNPICELRLVSKVPIEFHVLTTLWIQRVGDRLEKSLSDNSYGNRLRRTRDGELSKYSLGTFKSYMPQYKKWRDGALNVMREAVDKGKDVIAITADFTAFYHSLTPDFLLDDDFWERMKRPPLTTEERRFTELIVGMINKWSSCTPLHKGLPVGCSISAVIANLALAEFDYKIEQVVIPLYYGRYVDDIILVIENTNHFADANSVWKWLHARIPAIRVKGKNIEYTDELVDKGNKSKLIFEQKKTKTFVVDADSGCLLLNAIERQIKERSSEWRSLPDLPESRRQLTAVLMSACNKCGVEVDSLRKVDLVSLRKAMFAMKVRDFESYCRNLSPLCWRKFRLEFLQMIKTYFTDLSSLFDLHQYFPRIISAACSCIDEEDVEAQNEVVAIFRHFLKSINSVEGYKISGGKEKTSKGEEKYATWQKKLFEYFFGAMSEWLTSTLSSVPAHMNMEVLLKSKIDGYRECSCGCSWEDLFACDLAYQPLRSWFLRDKCVLRDLPGLKTIYPLMRQLHLLQDPESLGVRKECVMALSMLWREMGYGTNMPAAFFFAVRPMSTSDVFRCIRYMPTKETCQCAYEALKYLRGYVPPSNDMMPVRTMGLDKGFDFDIHWSEQRQVSLVALVNWQTDDQSYAASVCAVPDPNELVRFRRTMKLINSIIASDVRPDYVVFPELSIPARWFSTIALKLKKSRISLIAGVEYLHDSKKGGVHNQVWCSLMTDALGFPDSYFIRFEKIHPAIHEQAELKKRANTRLVFDMPNDRPIIVRHGSSLANMCFSTLICSDLLNVDYRSFLRSKVDVVFVPSWNQDVDLYSSLVESAAFDLHSYIAVCNDRKYGDTRIRAPYHKNYKRDIVKIKGGESDYFVIGKVDVDALRRFQSYEISPTGEDALFKPVPIGFKISEERKTLPQ